MKPGYRLTHLAGVLALALSCAALPAGAADAARVNAAIDKQLRLIEEKWTRQDAQGIVRAAYTDDVTIAGEGMPDPVANSQAARSLLEGLIADAGKVRISVYRTEVLGPRAALTWLSWHVTPRAPGQKPYIMKSLLVWKKTGAAWKIHADMFANGPMAPARP